MSGTRVYVGDLPRGTSKRDLERFFRNHGRIREISLKQGGYGFVVFDDCRDAEYAIYNLNREKIMGERIRVERARHRGRHTWGESETSSSGSDRERTRRRSRFAHPIRTDHKVIVENVSRRASWQDLKDYMRQAGDVTYADAHLRKKNEALVHFASRKDMQNAIEQLNGSMLFGRRIKVYEKKSTRGEESSSSSYSTSRSGGGRSRSSRSGSRDRSRSRDDRTHAVSDENGHRSS
ncbi:unnamed protein product [Ceutorhynchus assimilis]|uniref:RRM domain-containing protein n=1 Tax=Ceutorhynchus assimilis TaxID=467358 RepID=A0A9N9QKK9_9CUCU|nr:unnamed protein product [Ceutorhynchus assimilis]